MDTKQFKQQLIRDLAWVMYSPNLLNANHDFSGLSRMNELEKCSPAKVISDAYCKQMYQKYKEWLHQADEHHHTFNAFSQQQGSGRLGYYFESLVQRWILQIHHPVCFVSHYQVRRGSRTLGEFDFLFSQRPDNTVQHWEVAVKFYLYFKDSNERISWYGPNARDQLGIKLLRLFEHQTKLGNYPEGKASLARLGFSKVQPKVFLKGYLFYPSSSDWRNPTNISDDISPQHLRGWWTDMSRFNVPQSTDNSRWTILPRLNWLSPASRRNSQTKSLLNLKTLHSFCCKHYLVNDRPLLFAELAPTPNEGWVEVSRGFIVPTTWPNSSSDSN